MAKTKLTEKIEKALCREFSRQYGCLEVSIGIGSRIKERVDFMVYDHYKDIFKCFEIKVSKADFNSSAAKSFVGNHNYYVMPYELFKEVEDKIPPEVGVYIARESVNGDYAWLESVKKCKRKNLTPDEVMVLKDSLIRSLSRDANRYYESQSANAYKNLKKEYNHIYRLWQKERKKAQEAEKEFGMLCWKLRRKLGANWEDEIK